VVHAPGGAAADAAEALVAAGSQGSGRIKAITSVGGLLDRLHAERNANRAAFGLLLDGGSG
jgi:hypothetical protein